MKLYYKMKLLYLETDASRIGLGATILQKIMGTSCPRDQPPDNIILRPIAFLSKSMTRLQQKEDWFREVPS